MKTELLVAAAMIFGLVGCQVGEKADRFESVMVPPAKMPVELPLLYCPVNLAKCELQPLLWPEYEKRRCCVVYDLNMDGSPEYFVQDAIGMNSVGFAVVDSKGNPLMATKEIGNIGGDRLIIMASMHFGYHDLVCSHWDTGGVEGSRWEFNGKMYVQTRIFYYIGDHEKDAYIEKVPGMAVARWYGDFLGRPPGDRPPNWHGG